MSMVIKPPNDRDRFSIWLAMLFSFFGFIAYRMIRHRYRLRSPILGRPFDIGFQPARLNSAGSESQESTTWHQQVGPVSFHCQKQKKKWFRPLRAINFINRFLKHEYGIQPGGSPNITIPKGLEPHLICVSIPAKNFRCGGKPTEFIPRDMQPGFWSYQMICGGVQMTLIHVEEHTYVAGVCIYAQNRWSIFSDRLDWAFSPERLVYHPRNLCEKSIERRWCRERNQWIIVTRNQFGEMDKFEFNGQTNSLEPIECSDCCLDPTSQNDPNAPETPRSPSSTTMPDCLNWLKVEFCQLDQKPVMLGKTSTGAICHFHWNPVISKFQLKNCERCQVEAMNRFELNLEDKPPPYEYLELIEMVEQ